MAIVGKYWPYLAIVFFGWMWVKETQQHAASIERCNTEKMASVAEAEKVAREAAQNALEGRIRDLEELSLDAQKARDIAIQARIEAENRPERVREVIRRVESENSCLNELIDPAVLDSMRSD